MKTKIFYFSGTGNCLKIARDLAAELGKTEAISIAKAIKSHIDTAADRIGFVFPVYALNVPLIVSDFIKRIEVDPEKYVFAITTYADVAGDVLGQFTVQLRKKNLQLSAGFGIRMPGNYTPFYGAIPADKQKKFFDNASIRIKKIAAIVKKAQPHKIEKSKFPLNLLTWALYPIVIPLTPSEDKKFWTEDKCNSCGTCEKVCPVDNIKMSGARPIWLHKCVQCFACLQWCPLEVIQCGRFTKGRKRYRNPYVLLRDFIQ